MPYNPGTGVYSLPAIYLATPGTTILAAQHNTPLEDLEVANNYARPIIAGGTGANNAPAALTALGALPLAGGTMTGNLTLTSTDAGATADPTITTYRNSASPAAADLIGRQLDQGKDSAANIQDYVRRTSRIDSPTSGAETSSWLVEVLVAGAFVTAASFNGSGILTRDGTAALPGFSFVSDPDSGIYRIGANTIGLSANGGVKNSWHVNGFTASISQFDLMNPNGPDSGCSISIVGQYASYINGATGASVQLGQNNSSFTAVNFIRVNVSVGSISCSPGATAYNTSSDKRLKTPLRPFDSGTILDRLQVGVFNWLAHPEITAYGVLAQDAYEVFPQAITEGDDDQGIPWSADYSKFVPVLLAEIKDLRRRLAAAGL